MTDIPGSQCQAFTDIQDEASMRDPLEGRLFLTVAELAKLMHLDPRTVRRGIAEGTIPAVRLGTSVRIPVPRVRDLLGLPSMDEPLPAA